MCNNRKKNWFRYKPTLTGHQSIIVLYIKYITILNNYIIQALSYVEKGSKI